MNSANNKATIFSLSSIWGISQRVIINEAGKTGSLGVSFPLADCLVRVFDPFGIIDRLSDLI